MKTVLVIRIPPSFTAIDGDTTVQWARYTSEGSLIEELHLTAINQIKATLPDDRPPEDIVLLVNGALCFYQRLTISSGQKKHLTTALPYLVEEDLAQDIETMHVVHGIPDADLNVSIAAIGHDVLQALLTLFEEYQLPLTRVVTETQFLPSQANFTSLLLDHDAVMITAPEHGGITLNYQALPILFSQQSMGQAVPDTLDVDSATNGNPPPRIILRYSDSRLAISAGKVDEVANTLSERGWLIDKKPLQGAVFELFAQQYFAAKPRQLLDFRQGAYRCPRRTGRIIRRWWPLTAVAGCWLLLELGLMLAQGVVYQQRSETLWQDSLASYLSVFPNDRQARQAQARQQMSFNVKQVLENRLRSLDQSTSKTPFLPMLQTLSGISSQTQARSLEFNNTSGQLIYEFATDELAGVNRFVEQLSAAGLQSKLDSANQGESGVIARVSIRR